MLCEVTLWPCLTFTEQNLPAPQYLFSFAGQFLARKLGLLQCSVPFPLFMTPRRPRPPPSHPGPLTGPSYARRNLLGPIRHEISSYRCGQVWAFLCESC